MRKISHSPPNRTAAAPLSPDEPSDGDDALRCAPSAATLSRPPRCPPPRPPPPRPPALHPAPAPGSPRRRPRALGMPVQRRRPAGTRWPWLPRPGSTRWWSPCTATATATHGLPLHGAPAASVCVVVFFLMILGFFLYTMILGFR